jgi:signal peptidase I
MNKEKLKSFVLRLWKEWRITIFFIVFVLIPAKSSLADWNWVPTGSMKPTVLEGDLIFVNKLAYSLRFPLTFFHLAKWSEPQTGDVVVCFSPDDKIRLVKRVIAAPGDTIEMRNNRLFLNGRQLEYTISTAQYQKYLNENQPKPIIVTENLNQVPHPVTWIPSVPAARNFGPLLVPKKKYFVMGDNRDNSRDSRAFGFIDRKLIVGKAQAVVFSFDITDKYQPRLNRFFSPLK